MILRMVTFNARGLMDMRKFEKVKEMCKREDVIMLQETNWKDLHISEIRKKWNGEIIYNNGDDRFGRGVAVLIRENRDIKCKVVYKDKVGKCIGFEMEYEEKKILVVNVHAPPEEIKKREYFNGLRELLRKYKEIVIMGDFNVVFSKLDMAEGMVFKTDTGRKELKGLMEENELIDVWRERNEKRKEFSRRQIVGNFICKTRIDFILCTRNMESFLEKIRYEETSLSDHKPIFMQIDWDTVKRGPGVWVLNTGILKNEDYVLSVQEIITKEKENGMYREDKRIWWENVKYLIKKFSIKYCGIIQRCKKGKERDIREQLEKELNMNEKDIQKIKEIEGKLKEIEEKKYNGARLRSKAKYTVEGEKCTKFFFDLERRRGMSQTIKRIQREDGEIVETNEEILKAIKAYYGKLFKAEGVKEEEKLELLKQIKTKVGEDDKKRV
jgi:exonuclease III